MSVDGRYTDERVHRAESPAGAKPQRAIGHVLVGSVVLMGLMAGLFWGFSISVMPGLGISDDRTFVTAMQNINAEIENALFGLVFVGALLLPAVAVVMQLARRHRRAAIWTAAAVVAYFLALVLTMGVEVPLNDALARAGAPDRIRDLHGVRTDFENVWVMVNHFRALLCTVAVACLGRSLALHVQARPAEHPAAAGPR